MHINTHKTFSTPHGGGGPGAGPVAVAKHLEPFLPVPGGDRNQRPLRWQFDRPQSIGRVHSYYGNFGILVRALAVPADARRGRPVAREPHGDPERQLPDAPAHAQLRAADRRALHARVRAVGARLKKYGVKTLDVAKRLLDFGVHAPTVYFPLIIEEALMIEPTETETLERLDYFAAAMEQIAREAAETPQLLLDAPHETPVRRLDEGRAARELRLTWSTPAKSSSPRRPRRYRAADGLHDEGSARHCPRAGRRAPARCPAPRSMPRPSRCSTASPARSSSGGSRSRQVLALESALPLSLVAGQALLFLEPFLAAILPAGDLRRFAKLIERREAVAALIERIESGAEAAHRERRERKQRERDRRRGPGASE
jgi:hypothetical protein